MKNPITFKILKRKITSVTAIPILLFCFSIGTLAQGESYTIGPDNADYATFAEAFSTLHTNGITGNVVFRVQPGTYTEQLIYQNVPGAGENSKIYFRSDTGNPEDVIVQFNASYDNNYVMKLDSARYVTFRSITFQATNNTYARVIFLSSIAEKLAFDNCVFKGSYYSFGDNNRTLLYSPNTKTDSLVLTNNIFSQGSKGISIEGAANNLSDKIEIRNNKFDSLGYAAMYLTYPEAPVISGNIIAHGNNGVYLYYSKGSTVVSGNRIDVNQTGINLSYFNYSDPIDKYALISNNIIAINRERVTYSENYGITLKHSNHIKIYNNTSVVYYNANNNSRALSMYNCNGSSIKVLNNNLVTLNDGYSMDSDQNTGSLSVCDYNNFYTPGTIFAVLNGIACEDFRTLKNITGYNSHSISAWPGFAGEDDFYTRSAWLDGKGTPLTEVTEDVDGNTRDTAHPDIGANEYDAPPEAAPPLSGTITIGSGAYPTLQDAVEDARLKGISDSLKIQFPNGTYEQHCVIPPIAGASSEHRIIIESASGRADDVTLSNDLSGYYDSYVLKLLGCSFLTIRNLTFESTNSESREVINLTGMTDSLEIYSCSFKGYPDKYTSTKFINSNYLNFHLQSYHENSFIHGNTSMYLTPQNPPSSPGVIDIENNNFSNYYQALFIYRLSPRIINNRINCVQGISVQYTYSTLQINNNYIIDSLNQSRGISISYCHLSQTNPGKIYNNFITSFGPNIYSAFEIANSDNLQIYYNTVHRSRVSETNSSPAFKVNFCNSIDIKNNIFSNEGNQYAVDIRNLTSSNVDNNCYYTTWDKLGYWNQERIDLDAIKSVSGMNEHSVSAYPGFVSYKDSHVTATALDSAGVPLTGITEDIDGDPRDPQYPDIGADEFGAVPPPVGTGDFEPTDIQLDQLGLSAGTWADYNVDGDMDILLTGVADNNDYELIKYHNNEGTFIRGNVIANIYPASSDAVAWGDFDNDNQPDLIVSGYEKAGVVRTSRTHLYRSTASVLIEIGSDININNAGSVDWGDYDNDGDIDLLTGGENSRIYRNDGQGKASKWVFTDIKTLPQAREGSVKWGDYDGDGDLDILLSTTEPSDAKLYLYENTGDDNFTEINTGIDNITGRCIWCDYNEDGFPDIIFEGRRNDAIVTTIYSNDPDNGSRKFTDINAGLTGLKGGSISFCDYDIDGDPDILITGWNSLSGGKTVTILYKNMGNDQFVSSNSDLPGIIGSGSWGDFNNDGKPDLLLTGSRYDPDHPETNGNYTTVFLNKINKENTPPAPPENLNFRKISDSSFLLYWDAGTDQETSTNSLTYNVKIGTHPQTCDVMSPMSNTSNGYLYVPKTGNAGSTTALLINNLQAGRRYYWSVQEIDPSYSGSMFAAEKNFMTTDLSFSDQSHLLPYFQGDVTKNMNFVDYDNDGDLDLSIISNLSLRIIKNDNGNFTEINTSLPLIDKGKMVWGDYDNDGDLDLFLFGYYNNITAIGKIYRNEGNDVFAITQLSTIGIFDGDACWEDYDNDGDQDLIVTGKVTEETYVFEIYRNDNGAFHKDSDFIFEGLAYSSLDMEDYNNDGFPDILVTGKNITGNEITKILNNEAGHFAENLNVAIPGVHNGSAIWGDYNADGYSDILITGRTKDLSYNGFLTYIYRNNGGESFTIVYSDEEQNETAAWGDFDADGDLDIIFSEENKSDIYLNNNGVFNKTGMYLPTDNESFTIQTSVKVGDYDNDGRLDFIRSGLSHILYHNDHTLESNHQPEAPEGLQAINMDSVMFLVWNYADDTETPPEGLSYNVRVGSTPGGCDIISPMADTASGYRRIVRPGNAGHNRFYKLYGLEFGETYYWSVQSIDNNFTGSAFAEEHTAKKLHAYTISGHIKTFDNLDPVTHATVSVLSRDQGGVITECFTTLLNGESNSYNTTPIPVDDGMAFIIKATPDQLYYPDLLPTYRFYSIRSDRANWFYLSENIEGSYADVLLKSKPPQPNGLSTVSGSLCYLPGSNNKTIYVSQNKSTAGNDPVPDIWVYLINNEGEVEWYDMTDSHGSFLFDSIPKGHYSFYADYKGWPMDTANDSLLLDQDDHNYKIAAYVSDSTIACTVADVTAVENHPQGADLTVWPNPVQDNLYLKFKNTNDLTIVISIFSVDGTMIKEILTADKTLLRIPVSDLRKGVYILKVNGKQINYQTKIVKQ